MEYRIEKRPSFMVVGLARITSNAAPAEIAELWSRFYSEGIRQRIPHRKGDEVYSVYMDYEKDHTTPYMLIIGCEVEDTADVPDGLIAKTVPAATYAVIDASGDQPSAIMNTWREVWDSALPRTYSGEFDRHSTDGCTVTVYVAVDEAKMRRRASA